MFQLHTIEQTIEFHHSNYQCQISNKKCNVIILLIIVIRIFDKLITFPALVTATMSLCKPNWSRTKLLLAPAVLDGDSITPKTVANRIRNCCNWLNRRRINILNAPAKYNYTIK